MRTLVRWSLSSLRTTTPRPWRAEPSRCMASSHHVLEVTVVDHVETGRLDREPQQSAAGGDHGRGRIRAHVALGVDAHVIGRRGLHRFHARYGPQLLRKALPFGLDVDIVADPEDLAAELAHRAKERDVALVEQRHAVTNALHAVEQMRRQQHAHTTILE